MTTHNVALTFACYNQLKYTKLLIESLVNTNMDLSRVVVVDNHSSDDTPLYLEQVPLGQVIRNSENFGCGVAWNQGILALQAEWTVVMNNDVVVTPGWLDDLIRRATELEWLVASPAMVEGPLDYDVETLAASCKQKVGRLHRSGHPHAVCMAIHKSVWQKVGFFRATPKLLGYEDGIFFEALRREGIACGTLGASWIHHFGSVTQTAMKIERGLKNWENLGDRFHAEIFRKSWLRRKVDKLNTRRQIRKFRDSEIEAAGISLHGERRGGQFHWI
jgi:GT2 family glycosyltransferase